MSRMDDATSGREQLAVFLSGGTRAPWRDRVVQSLGGVTFFDPKTLWGAPTMAQIANTERAWLDKSDAVFFYFEESNPSGLGSAFEVGYAVARGMPVVFVDEKQTHYTEWLGTHCSYVTHDLTDGIKALHRILEDLASERAPSA